MLLEKVAKRFLLLGVLSLSAGLCGCGVGNKGNTDTTSNSTTITCGVSNSGIAYLFFSTADSTCPDKPRTVDAGTEVKSTIFNPAWVFPAGTYDSATKTVNAIHNYAMVYANTNGNLYKVSALKGSSSPVPTQLSSASSAETICSVTARAIDLANPDNSQIVYRTPGANATCNNNDDTYKMVRLSMGASDAPITAKQPIGTAMHNWSTGAITYWLVNDAGALKRCDANFANCSGNLLAVSSYASQWAIAGPNRWLLEIDHVVYVYDGDTNTLSAARHSIGGTNQFVTGSITDGSNFYFVTSNEPRVIYKASVAVDGSVMAAAFVTDSANPIGGFTLSTNTLLYWTSTGITRVVKSNGSATALATGTAAGVFAVNGNHVYYNYTLGSGTPTAGSIDDDGNNKTETASASWSGVAYGTSWNLTDGFAAIYQAQTIIRADGYSAGTGFAGAKLNSYNAASKALVAALGTVPTDITSISCSSFGPNMLCNGFNATPQSDIFLLNAETVDSLVRVTNTPTKNEYPIY